jgi:uncharacterized protein YjiK
VPRRALRLDQQSTRPLAMRGASAVAAVPHVAFLAEDDDGIYRLARGRLSLWAPASRHPALADLEGLATDAKGRHVWALAEESGEVVRVSGTARRSVVSLGRLVRPGRRRNKGYEGLAYLPRSLSPNGRASLVAVHEGKPRRVGIFTLPDLVQTHDLKLPPEAKSALADLADVTADPVTGALLLLSEESRRIGVCLVRDEGLEMQSVTDIDVIDEARPEGLDFVTPSRLVVVTEAPATMIAFRVTRASRRE